MIQRTSLDSSDPGNVPQLPTTPICPGTQAFVQGRVVRPRHTNRRTSTRNLSMNAAFVAADNQKRWNYERGTRPTLARINAGGSRSIGAIFFSPNIIREPNEKENNVIAPVSCGTRWGLTQSNSAGRRSLNESALECSLVRIESRIMANVISLGLAILRLTRRGALSSAEAVVRNWKSRLAGRPRGSWRPSPFEPENLSMQARAEARCMRTGLGCMEQCYRGFLTSLPVPALRIDALSLVRFHDELREGGLVDPGAHIEQHPDLIQKAISLITVTSANRQAVELFKAQQEEDLLGPISTLMEGGPREWLEFITSVYNGDARRGVEAKLRALDNSVADALWLTSPLEGRQDAGGLTVLVDVKNRIQSEQVLAEEEVRVAHTTQLAFLGELMATIAHEVSQPLSAIVINAEASLRWLDRSKVDKARVRSLIERTCADAHRANNIIFKVRELAMPARVVKQVPTDLNSILEEVATFLSGEFRRHKITLVFDLAVGMPLVMGDKTQLQQVLVNLAMNAVHVLATTDPNSRRLTFRTSLAGSGTVRVEIEDTGPGIPEERLDRIFDSFFTTKPAGMGLGLYISRTIVESHGGMISAVNVQGQHGACFTITFPVEKSR